MSQLKKLNLSVLAYDGPMARIYLEVLKNEGFVPEHVCLMVQRRWFPAGRILSWLPQSYVQRLAKWRQATAINHWPRRLLPLAHYQETLEGLNQLYPDATKIFARAYQKFSFSDFGASYSEVVTDGYQDPSLVDRINKLPGKHLLFTGGGIVPEKLLTRSNKKFVHVHPGFLPEVRGADGLLWSALSREKLGASVFFLDAGIDTGEVLYRQEVTPIALPLPLNETSDNNLYRTLFSFYDPLLRAVTLTNFLMRHPEITNVTPTPQATDIGTTFHFMHPRVRAAALQKLFFSA